MLVSHSNQSTPRTNLRGIVGIDGGNSHSDLCRFVSDSRFQCVVEPTTQTPSGSASEVVVGSPLWLRHIQILQNENRIFWTPTNQLFCDGSSECLGSIMLFAPQPFEETNNRMGIRSICLLGRKFTCETTPEFSQFDIFYLHRKAIFEKLPSVGINCDNHVSDVSINADREYPLRFWNVDRNAQVAVKPSTLFNEVQTVVSDSRGKARLGELRNLVVDLLSAFDGPDRELAVFGERGITPFFSNQKQSVIGLESERRLGRMFIPFGGDIRTGSQTDNCAGHLGVKPIDAFVGFFVQIKSRQWFAFIEAFGRNIVLFLGKSFECCTNVWRRFNDDRDSELRQHNSILSTKVNKPWWSWNTTQFLHWLKPVVPLR